MGLFLFVTLIIFSVGYASHPLIDVGWLDGNFLPPLVAPGLFCEDPLYKYCQANFNTYLNASSSLDWTNVTAMEMLINQYLLPDLGSGLFVLCNARAGLEICLGTQYRDCLNPYNFIRHNVELYSAYQYASLFRSLEFDCNGGNIQATKNWPCLYSVYTNPAYGVARNECLSAYLSSVYNGTDYCTAGQNLLPCMARIFDQFNCSFNPDGSKILDIRWFECERYRVSFQIEGGCPTMSCSTIIFGSVGFFVDPRHADYMDQQKIAFYDSMSSGSKKKR